MLVVTLPKRGKDDWGDGAFHAPRKHGAKTISHKGLDLACYPDTVITAPAAGAVTKLGYCYADDPHYRYVEITDRAGLRHRVFYVEPSVGVGSEVIFGDTIGVAQNVAIRYHDPRKDNKVMKNHVHYEVLDPVGIAMNPEHVS